MDYTYQENISQKRSYRWTPHKKKKGTYIHVYIIYICKVMIFFFLAFSSFTSSAYTFINAYVQRQTQNTHAHIYRYMCVYIYKGFSNSHQTFGLQLSALIACLFCCHPALIQSECEENVPTTHTIQKRRRQNYFYKNVL